MLFNDDDLALLNELETDMLESTDAEIKKTHALVIERTGLSSSTSLWRKRRTIIILAAVLSVMILAGAGYLSSRYFDKFYWVDKYSSFETGISYGVPDTPQITYNGDIIRVTDLDAALEELTKDLKVGEIYNRTVESDEGIFEVQAIRGDTVTNIWYTREGTDETTWTTRTNDMEKQDSKPVEELIAEGVFVATLNSPDYTLLELAQSGGKDIGIMSYSVKSGGGIMIRYVKGRRIITEEQLSDIEASDIRIGGKVFTLVKSSRRTELHLYLENDGECIVKSLNLTAYNPNEDAEKILLDAAEYLTLHNEQANLVSGYYENLFSSFNDPIIRDSATEIAGLLTSAEPARQRNGGEKHEKVWENEGRVILKGLEPTDEYLRGLDIKPSPILSVSKNYEQSYGLLPYAEPVPFTKENWFPNDKLQNLNIYFFNNRSYYNAEWRGNDNYVLTLEDGWETDSTSPLDIIVSNFNSGQYGFEPYRTVWTTDNIPYLISKTPDEPSLVRIDSAVYKDGRYVYFSLLMPESELPNGSVEGLSRLYN